MRLLLFTVLLAILGEVRAEGAWVLWVSDHYYADPQDRREHVLWRTNTTTWHIRSATTDEAACRQQLTEALTESIETVTHLKRAVERAVIFYKVDKETLRLAYFPKNAKSHDKQIAGQDFSFHCLPDTIDPRVPTRNK